MRREREREWILISEVNKTFHDIILFENDKDEHSN